MNRYLEVVQLCGLMLQSPSLSHCRGFVFILIKAIVLAVED